jgi:hypothetical protein
VLVGVTGAREQAGQEEFGGGSRHWVVLPRQFDISLAAFVRRAGLGRHQDALARVDGREVVPLQAQVVQCGALQQ